MKLSFSQHNATLRIQSQISTRNGIIFYTYCKGCNQQVGDMKREFAHEVVYHLGWNVTPAGVVLCKACYEKAKELARAC